MFKKISREKILSIISIMSVLLLWQLITLFVEPLYLPSPIKVVVDSYKLYKDILISSILSSVFRAILGFIIGTVLGIIVAIIISWNKTLRALFDPIVELIRPIPVLALIPLFILWFGLGELGKILIVATGSFVTLVVSTSEAIRNVPPVYIQAAKTLGAGKKIIFKTVILRAITPDIVGGVRVAAAASFGQVAAAEFLGAKSGIGYIIIQARRFLYTHGVIFGIVLFSMLSWLADRLVKRIDLKINDWTQRNI